MHFSVIAALDLNRGIGKKGLLPWQLKGDMAYFKTLTNYVFDETKKNMVIMGRNTWESLPKKVKPLAKRQNVIVTATLTPFEVPDDVVVVPTLDDAIAIYESGLDAGTIEHAYVIGGARLYEEALQHPNCQILFLTHIQGNFECDVFFPNYQEDFVSKNKTTMYTEDKIEYYFELYQRR